jgi:IS1 family transposase
MEIDEFWTYVEEKKNKIWLIYAYHRESGGIVGVCMEKAGLENCEKFTAFRLTTYI